MAIISIVVFTLGLSGLGFMVWLDSKPATVEALLQDVIADPTPTPVPAKRVGIQAGHWNNEELPDELAKLRYTGTGTSVNGVDEWQVNLDVSRKVATLLRNQGMIVDILPATVPENYLADAFLSIHTDGNDVSAVSGFKVAASDFDQTGQSDKLALALEGSYQTATDMSIDSNITDDMTQYYAFNNLKYLHALNSATPGAIIETGFLTNSADRSFLLNHQDQVAEGLSLIHI